MIHPLFAMVTYGTSQATHAIRQNGTTLCNSIGERKVLRVAKPAPPAAMPDCSYCCAIINDWMTACAPKQEAA